LALAVLLVALSKILRSRLTTLIRALDEVKAGVEEADSAREVDVVEEVEAGVVEAEADMDQRG